MSLNQTRSSKVKRLTFSYEGNDIKLISQKSIEKIIPPSTPLNEIQNNLASFWFELTDNQKNVIYRRTLENQIKTDIEIFSNDSTESIARQKLSEVKGVFSILIPDDLQAESLDIFSKPIVGEEKEMIKKEANKIFHLDLKSKLDDK